MEKLRSELLALEQAFRDFQRDRRLRVRLLLLSRIMELERIVFNTLQDPEDQIKIDLGNDPGLQARWERAIEEDDIFLIIH